MTRSSFTRILLGGALAAACSKPNPLFLDTWDVVTDSGGNSLTGEPSASGATIEPPTTSTASVTSAESTDPTWTTGTSTTTASSDVTTAVTPGTTETTGDPPLCDADMNGCCKVTLHADKDSFFVEATDGVGNPGCPLVTNPGPFSELPCGKWNFGRASSMRIFNDYDGVWIESVKGASAFGMHFPSKSGELVLDGLPIPWDFVQKASLELAVEVDWNTFGDFQFSLYGLTGDQNWLEGDGVEVVPCTSGGSSYYCLDCGDKPNDPCTQMWADNDPLQLELGMVSAVQGKDENWIEVPIADPSALTQSPGGLVLLPFANTIDGVPNNVPSGAMIVKSRDGGAPPKLHLELCM